MDIQTWLLYFLTDEDLGCLYFFLIFALLWATFSSMNTVFKYVPILLDSSRMLLTLTLENNV